MFQFYRKMRNDIEDFKNVNAYCFFENEIVCLKQKKFQGKQ